ncbi:thiopeptide-type bacteriocin biosynthesis protein [Kitasatospora sp. NBC_01560]|uniref:thiopeptide-type bacteriocin biosynthesis protein n=1 Tax=Kitasatospora sp. NBC_01560 TaxID=2975965 RepID=UPI00386AB99E
MTGALDGRPRWSCWHLHLDSAAPALVDTVLLDVVEPVVRELRADGAITGWFFIRYWQHGPHLRLRLAGLDGAAEPGVTAALAERLAPVNAGVPDGERMSTEQYHRSTGPIARAGEGGADGFEALPLAALRPGGVHREPYTPETDRYGGPALLGLSESLFGDSSELVAAVLRARPNWNGRVSFALLAIAGAVRAADPDEVSQERFLRGLRASWLTWAGRAEHPGMNPLAAREASLRSAGLLAARFPGGPGALPGAGRAADRWAERLGGAMDVWRDAARAGTLSSGPPEILASHLHMTLNRLGFGPEQEVFLLSVLIELWAGRRTAAAA